MPWWVGGRIGGRRDRHETVVPLLFVVLHAYQLRADGDSFREVLVIVAVFFAVGRSLPRLLLSFWVASAGFVRESTVLSASTVLPCFTRRRGFSFRNVRVLMSLTGDIDGTPWCSRRLRAASWYSLASGSSFLWTWRKEIWRERWGFEVEFRWLTVSAGKTR